jgi:hypothetical protein
MNLRHAAAIALTGWYLMVPSSPYFIGIPIANWQRRPVFDNKAQCQIWRLNLIQHPPKDLSYPSWDQPQCVSSDDPRLAR